MLTHYKYSYPLQCTGVHLVFINRRIVPLRILGIALLQYYDTRNTTTILCNNSDSFATQTEGAFEFLIISLCVFSTIKVKWIE